MPSSMTGFGQADANGFHVEIKSVNHRYRDIRIKVPRDIGLVETSVRDMIQRAVHRGKVDVIVTHLSGAQAGEKPWVNWDLARAAHKDLCAMAEEFGGEVTFRDVLLVPGVLEQTPDNPDDMAPLVIEALSLALENFNDARSREGAHLAEDILERVASLDAMTRTMKDLASNAAHVYKERLYANLNALLATRNTILDEARLEQEVALLADRSDVTEELVRLGGHIRLLEETIAHGSGPIGRQADFILQEINREINTIGSKSQLAELSRLVIDAKTELEKIREQIQNIE